MTNAYKSRPFKGSSDFVCPVHKETVVMKVRMGRNKINGRKQYAGHYMMCPKYYECKYWVSPFNERGATVAVLEAA